MKEIAESRRSIINACTKDYLAFCELYKEIFKKPFEIDKSYIARYILKAKYISKEKQTKRIINKYGITNISINAGGQILALRFNYEKSDYTIGIEHPRKKDKLLTVLKETNRCIATSGDYENYFSSKGKKYHHIFNPADLNPSNKAISATVILNINSFEYPSTWADGLSTALFVMGPETGLKLVKQLKNADAIIVTETKDGIKIFLSDNLSSKNLKFNY